MTDTTVATLGRDTFVDGFLRPGRPVLVRNALAGWPVATPWDLESLTRRFGDRPVPLYDTLFALNGYSTFRDYVAKHTGAAVSGIPPYLRWFARQNQANLPWADAAFAELAAEWTMPDWLPDSDYVFPRTVGPVSAARDPFPAKGLFVCGRGGRTRLHVDPWASDACLCQAVGSKRVTMFGPDAAALLSAGDAVVDLDHPDDRVFPRWREAVPVFEEVLQPGDAVFIPSGWYHMAVALTDSVSITWNFVHRTHGPRFARYLRSGGADDLTVRYFLSP
ncbi:cupin-like domain-containing protein [Micromonosporaceae bacterium B7E4]